MRTVSLVLAIFAAMGVAVVSGSGVVPASETAAAPLPLAAVSHFQSGGGGDPGVCTNSSPSFPVGLDAGTSTLPASLVLTTTGDYCESNNDCATGEECDLDINECVEPNPCNQVCDWVPTGRCEWKCYGNDNDPCIEERYVCEYEWDCWIECGD